MGLRGNGLHRRLAERDPFAAGSRRAIVATGNLVYGMSRMYMAYSDGQGAEMRVYRSLEAARQWLGLNRELRDAQ